MDILKKFSGTWNLIDMYVKKGTSFFYPLGQHPKGILIYNTDGYMSVEIIGENRPAKLSMDFAAGLPEEQLVITQYASYSGTFQICENMHIITHHVNFSAFPNWEKTELKRSYTFEKNRLTLTAIPIIRKNSSETDIFKLVWEKI
ncbi:hypothetical protein IKE_05762 [Bacillus cereus VD196]|uniref:Lipocalin-like domain-containing protein n=1 Tax=Bacillus cereus VD196 TaxID=1053243 RepID=A0A9W5PYP1_BACCE|nr:lipocalin-like domain-containing protein [Bacillus cereus]EOO61975.1 hypothetical protein IKE_05765 [Bacillus cereus VD196]EOO62102.1 hypothetical protein IKE_05762 [Bacillus cereus VD196]